MYFRSVNRFDFLDFMEWEHDILLKIKSYSPVYLFIFTPLLPILKDLNYSCQTCFKNIAFRLPCKPELSLSFAGVTP